MSPSAFRNYALPQMLAIFALDAELVEIKYMSFYCMSCNCTANLAELIHIAGSSRACLIAFLWVLAQELALPRLQARMSVPKVRQQQISARQSLAKFLTPPQKFHNKLHRIYWYQYN